MIDFFTPVQVSSVSDRLGQQYQIEKYKNDPFMLTPIKIQSIGDHRRKMIQWLKNMSIGSRINKLTFTDKQFTCLLMSMFQKLSDKNRQSMREFQIIFSLQQQQIDIFCRGFKINEDRYIRKASSSLIDAQQKLINSILIVNRYTRFDSFTIDSDLASDIDNLFNLFDIIQNGVSHELTLNNYKNYVNEDNTHLMFYNPVDNEGGSMTKSLGTWLVEVIKKNISVQYFKQCEKKKIAEATQNKVLENDSMHNNTQQKKTMAETFKQKAKQFKKYWKILTQTQRKSLIQKILTTNIHEILSQYQQIIKMQNKSFPNIKYSHSYLIKQFINNLINKDGQNLLNQLVFTKISDSFFQISIYKYQIILQIENQIQKKKNQENISKMKKKIEKNCKVKKISNNYNNMNNNNNKGNNSKLYEQKYIQTERQNKNKILQTTQTTKNINNNLIEKSQQHQNSIQIKNNRVKTSKHSRIKDKKKKNKKTVQNDESFEGCRQMSETTNDQDDNESEGKQAVFQIYSQQSRKLQSEIQLKKVLYEFSQRISTWNKYQQIALNRVTNILHSYNLSYQLFGSFANGLAISSSDIDISINPTIIHYFYGNFCSYRQKIIMSLQFLQTCFQQMTWATNFNLIAKALVPVLTFEIDLSVIYGNPKDSYYNVAKNRKGPKVYVDITIQPFANMTQQVMPHLGLDSTALVREWISQYHILSDLIKIFKHLLNKEKLNKSFTGGLSSYALTTILYIFLKSDESRQQKSIYSLLLQFCSFFININEPEHIHNTNRLLDEKNKLQKLIVLNYLNGKNLTQNCYKFVDIKQLLKKIKAIIENNSGENNKQYSKKIRNLFLG